MTSSEANKPTFDTLKDQLRFARTGRFYRLNQSLSVDDHKKLVESVKRDLVDATTQGLSGLQAAELGEYRSETLAAKTVKGGELDAFGTLYIQPVLLNPGMASSGALLKELRFAHLLILEGAVKKPRNKGVQWYAFVSRDILEDPLAGHPNLVTPLSRAELLNPFLTSSIKNAAQGRIEELSLRMMNISRVGMRRKVVEAYDVESAISSLGLHRSIPGTMKIRLPRNEGVGTAVTVSSSRQSVRAGSSRVKLSTVTEWFAQCVLRLDAEFGEGALKNKFLSEMASPLDTLDGLVPTSLLLDYAALDEEGYGSIYHWIQTENTPKSWTNGTFIDCAFAEPVKLTPVKQKAIVTDKRGAKTVAKVSPSDASKPRTFLGRVPDGAGGKIEIKLEVERGSCRLVAATGSPLGMVEVAGDRITFEQFVNRAKALRVAFDGGKVLYAAEGAHQSGNLDLAVGHLLAAMTAVPELGEVVSEKGHSTLNQSDTTFPLDSCFSVIENNQLITNQNSTLVCGDAKDEVFDYLEISELEKRLRWLHAKVQKRLKNKQPVKMDASEGSLSASSLQEVVGQAIKNLAFLRRDAKDSTLQTEAERWKGKCTLPVQSEIMRVRRGDDAIGKLKKIVGNALAKHEVAIVIPTYSKAKLEKEFNQIQSGQAEQTTIQLFWLLSGFTHACVEVGVVPIIFLRD
jgi:hypothetical protein